MNKKELMLDDFEHKDITKYNTNHTFVNSYELTINNQCAKYGQNSLQLTYDFGGWTSGNGAMYIIFKEKLFTDKLPVKLGVWVHGDKKSPWLRAVFTDGTGDKKTVNLTDGNIDWAGWKYLDTPIEQDWVLPIRLGKIYAVETDKTNRGNPNYRGRILLDQIRFVYADDEDLSGPYFRHTHPVKDVVYTSTFTFSTKVIDDMSGVDPSSIIVTVNGKQVTHQYCEDKSIISYSFKDIKEKKLHIKVTAKDFAGNFSLPAIDKTIQIDLSPDEDKPVLSHITPFDSTVTYTNKPRITFHVIDNQSGINEEDIMVTLNNQQLKIIYDEKTGWCYAHPIKAIADGKQIVNITVSDRVGNQLGPITRNFYTKTIRASKRNNLTKIAIIPDTHDVNYTKLAIQHVAKEHVDFVIQMGDLVDQATKEEFQQTEQALNLLIDKPIIKVAGNHESFLGNLHLFTQYNGFPTFNLEYNDTCIIILNSAFEQSISKSDSTQFYYLKKVLNQTTHQNIVIATHVPTIDTFGTAHQMKEEDAQQLEMILGDYKKENKDKNITVLFGHLHVLQSWEKDGVNYIITGNGARKGYVANKLGNVLGYGILYMNKEHMTYEYKPYVKSISIKAPAGLLNTKESYSLRVIGHISGLDGGYSVDLTDFHLINKRWTTKDPSVLSINKAGLIYTKQAGTATVDIELNGKFASVTLNIV